jgi:hypothetical protein
MSFLEGFSKGMSAGSAGALKELDRIQRDKELKEKQKIEDAKLEQKATAEQNKMMWQQKKFEQEQNFKVAKEENDVLKDYSEGMDYASANASLENIGSNVRVAEITKPDGSVYEYKTNTDGLSFFEGMQEDLNEHKGEGYYKVDELGVVYKRNNAMEEFQPIEELMYRGTKRKVDKDKDSLVKTWNKDEQAWEYIPKEVGTLTKDKPSDSSEAGTGIVDIVGSDGKQDKMTRSEYLSIPQEQRPDLWENKSAKQEIDQTYKMKFDIARNKIKEENPNIDDVELDAAAMDYVRSTADERTTNRIENKKKALKKEYNVESIVDIDILRERKNTKKAVKFDNLFNDIAKANLGSVWRTQIEKASEAVTNVDKLLKSSTPYTKDVSDEKLSNTNFLNRMYDNTIGNYLGDNATSEEKRVAAKNLSSIMNVVRNEQFGAVVPAAEATKFNDAATSLYQSSPNILIGVESMLKDQVYKMEEAKSVIGEELFYLKYGDRINKINNRIEDITRIRQGKKKDKKPLDISRFKIKN